MFRWRTCKNWLPPRVANKLIIVALLAAPMAQAAETDFRSLTPPQRANLGQEIRQVLAADPALVLSVIQPPTPSPYADAVNADRQMLRDLAPRIFADDTPLSGTNQPPALALVTAPNCPDCDAMQELLTGWADQGRVRLYTLPLQSPEAQALGLDTAPSYVFETMIVRGDVPPIVLEKYLEKQAR